MGNKWQFHYSSLDLFSRCGVAFEFRHLKKIRSPKSISIVVGSAVDKAASADLKNKIDVSQLLPREAVLDAARDEVVRQFSDEEVVPSREDLGDDGLAADRDAAIDASTSLADLQHLRLAPHIFEGLKAEECQVQRSFVVDVEGITVLGSGVQLVGTMDIVQGTRSIDDIKTSAKSPSAKAADDSMQLTTYALADAVLRGGNGQLARPVNKVQLHFLVRTKKRHDLKLVQIESVRTVEQFPPILARVEALARSINSGVFSPASTNSWWCSETYCPYWEMCPFAMRPTSVSVPEEVCV